MYVKTTRGLVLVALLAGALGGALGAIAVGRSAAAVAPALPAAPLTGEAELRRELESVRQQLAGLQQALQAHEAREQERMAGRAAIPVDAVTPSRPAPEATDEAAARDGSAVDLGAAASAQFSRETRDAAWSPYMERQLEASLRELPPGGSSLKSVDCMATLCRVVLTHASQEERGDFLFSLARLPPFQTELRYVPEDGDVLTTTVYVTRPGSQLPTRP